MTQTTELYALKILLVDETPRDLLLLHHLLQDAGYSDIRDLTEPLLSSVYCRTFEPDLVVFNVTDHDDSLELLQQLRDELRQLTPESVAGGAPILAMIEAGQIELRRKAILAGATDLMLKPFDYTEAVNRIEQLLRARCMQRAIINNSQAQAAAPVAKRRRIPTKTVQFSV